MNDARGMKILEETRVLTVVRGVDRGRILHVGAALRNGGMRMLEITLDTPEALEMIGDLRRDFADELLVGAGTVTNLADAKRACDTGAAFLVTPNTDPAVIEYAVKANIPCIAGAFTPTEILTAWHAGASVIKLYPVGTLGLPYFKELTGPLKHIPMAPFGGVHAHNVADYLRAGCYAVGINSAVINLEQIQAGNYTWVEDKTRDVTTAIQQYLQETA